MKKLFFSLFLALSLSLSASPVLAVDAEAQPATLHDTYAFEQPSKSSGVFRFGSHYFTSGNKLNPSITTDGMLFSLGNQLTLQDTSTTYTFAAGNSIDYSGRTDKDLFLAGNRIVITAEAKIGRDVYVAANNFIVTGKLPNDLSVAAESVQLENATIAGNVNLTAENIIFSGEVEILGKLTYNDDANIQGLENATYATIETYTPSTHTPTASELWLNQFYRIVGLFAVIALLLLLFPRWHERLVTASISGRGLGKTYLSGCIVLFALPVVGVALLLSYIASSAGIAVLGLYILLIYLATAFAGVWLGHLIVEKLFHSKLPIILEALIGLIVIGCLSMIPGISLLASIFITPLGLGLIMSCLRPGKQKDVPCTKVGKNS